MVINRVIDGRTVTITPEGQLNATTSDELLEFVLNELQGDADKLVLDFSRVPYISSKGLRALLTIYKQLNGRTMEITGANAAVCDVLGTTGFAGAFGVR